MDDFVSQNSKVTKIKVSTTYEGVTVYGLQVGTYIFVYIQHQVEGSKHSLHNTEGKAILIMYSLSSHM